MNASDAYQWVEHHLARPPAGVYMLLLRGEVVYVGQSEDLFSRIGHHFRERDKVFDGCRYTPLPLTDLDAAETALIAQFRPRYNGTPGGGGWRGRLLAVAEDVETAVGFLTNTDEDGIQARDLYRRVQQRTNNGTSAQLFHAAMDADPRVRHFPSDGVYRLVLTP
jgi:hypothetical protein